MIYRVVDQPKAGPSEPKSSNSRAKGVSAPSTNPKTQRSQKRTNPEQTGNDDVTTVPTNTEPKTKPRKRRRNMDEGEADNSTVNDEVPSQTKKARKTHARGKGKAPAKSTGGVSTTATVATAKSSGKGKGKSRNTDKMVEHDADVNEINHSSQVVAQPSKRKLETIVEENEGESTSSRKTSKTTGMSIVFVNGISFSNKDIVLEMPAGKKNPTTLMTMIWGSNILHLSAKTKQEQSLRLVSKMNMSSLASSGLINR